MSEKPCDACSKPRTPREQELINASGGTFKCLECGKYYFKKDDPMLEIFKIMGVDKERFTNPEKFK